MTSSQATAEIFLTALRALPKKEREAVLSGIAEDDELREDLLDLALLAERRDEPSRPFREYVAEKAR
ncbi:MAG: hypothetical protein ABIF82_11545 [Planctomycetota bacterium]